MSDASVPKKNQYGDLPGNSKKGKESKPEVKQITSGNVVSQRKKKLGRRIMESFTGDDSRTVGNYVFFDVVLPAVKQLISDALSTGVERLLFGEGARGSRRGYTAYNRYSGSQKYTDRSNFSGSPMPKPNPRAVHDFDDIVLDNRGAAEEVIDALDELIKNFDQATVSDFYQLVGITGTYQDDKWGWNSMAGARVERVRDGYAMRLPKTMYLE